MDSFDKFTLIRCYHDCILFIFFLPWKMTFFCISIPTRYLLDTSRHLFKWLFQGFSWQYLDTSSMHRKSFFNSLPTQYLLNTVSIHRRILLLTPPRYLMKDWALNPDTSRHLLDLSRKRVLYKDKGQPDSFQTQISWSLSTLLPNFFKTHLPIPFSASFDHQTLGMCSKSSPFHHFSCIHAF